MLTELIIYFYYLNKILFVLSMTENFGLYVFITKYFNVISLHACILISKIRHRLLLSDPILF